MNEKMLRWASGVVLGLLATSCGSVQDVKAASGASDEPGHDRSATDADDEDGDEDQNEVEVALDEVPDAVKKAALAAVPGLVLESAEMETEEGSLHYCLEGTANAEAVEVEVRATDAKVLEIERGDEDDD